MVLQPNFAKCNVSNVENTPPSILPKSLTSRFFAHRRRARSNGQVNSNKYAAEQAARRSRKQPPKQLKFNITVTPSPDVVMSDAPPLPSSSSSSTVPVALPKQLGRPMYQEVTREALLACSPSFSQVPAAYLRDSFEFIGPHALKSLASVRPQPFSPNKLPSEVEVQLDCDDPLNPTHMLAIYGPPPASTSRSMSKCQVTLYPVHAHFLAMHCSRLPPFPPFKDTVAKSKTLFKIPVRTLCLPSPSTYARLSTYIYTRNSAALLSNLMPLQLPPGIVTPAFSIDGSPVVQLPPDEHRKLVTTYVYKIASDLPPQTIVQYSTVVHGLWQNTCALGIFDDGLWEVIDLAWQILLAALAVRTGASIDLVFGEEEST